jgi:L-amino acid N-acyltransferase YncA
MIRLATRADLDRVHELVMEFLKDTAYTEYTDQVDPAHIKKLCYAVLTTGRVWLYDVDTVTVGLLIAVMEQNVWIPTKQSLRELVWYVKPEYRRTTAGGRLFKAFCDEGNQLLISKTIDGYFTTRMATTGEYDLSKRGFREVERLFLKGL